MGIHERQPHPQRDQPGPGLPLTPPHAAAPPGTAEQPGGLLLGAAYCPDPATPARVLRHILRCAVSSGYLVVSTASPAYQALVGSLGFRAHGATRDDVYRCGRAPEVYSNDFRSASLADWLSRLGAGAAPTRTRRTRWRGL
ncbi:hypothetical protein AB0N23_22000 [Streptomyces sp. NPDC052644]